MKGGVSPGIAMMFYYLRNCLYRLCPTKCEYHLPIRWMYRYKLQTENYRIGKALQFLCVK